MIFATGLHDPEGPLLLPDGGWLVTEMGPTRGCVTAVAADGQVTGIVCRTGRPNGLALGADGEVWIAESAEPALLRLDLGSGTVTTVATQFRGADRRSTGLLWPNDLCFGPDGALYLTDSGIHMSVFASDGGIGADDLDRRKQTVEENVDGRLLRLDPASGELECLASGLRFPNGIAFGPGGTLYVNETLTGDVLAFELDDSGVSERWVHGNVLAAPPGGAWAGPDGMAFDADGRLYVGVLGQADVTVLDPSGAVAARYPVSGSLPTNVAFGPPGSRRIYVTENVHGQIECLDAPADSLPLHRPAGGS
jgi:gluconolactonase